MATIRWTGAAQDIQQVQTVTVANTWAAGDTGTLTINNKSLIVTVGTAVTTTDVASAIAAAVNSPLASQGLVGDETKNFGGQEIPEFREVIATSSGAVVTLKSRTPGQPFTLTVSEVTAGTGTLATSVTTAATGSTFLSNAANYSSGTVPVDDDTLVFSEGSASVLNALDHFRTNNIDLNIIITDDYTGQIGRPAVNPGGYAEYRARHFQYRGTNKTLSILPGRLGNTSPQAIRLDFQSQASTSIVVRTARGGSVVNPHIFFAGGGAGLTSCLVEQGVVIIEPEDSGTSSGSEWRCPVAVGKPGGKLSDAYVYIGSTARQYLGGAVVVYSGVVDCAAATKLSTDENAITVYGGEINLSSTGAYGDINIYEGGSCYPLSGSSMEKVQVFGGTLDFSRGSDGVTINDGLKVYAGSTVIDSVVGSIGTFDAVGCSLGQLKINLRPNRQFTLTSTATP